MRVQTNARSSFIVGVAAFLAAASGLGCYENSGSFQPVAYGARPWTPPDGWYPDDPPYYPCATGYYIAIDANTCIDPSTRKGCTGPVAYALCTGVTHTQCTCGGPFWPGVECPKSVVCCPNDFPPFNWLENATYSGPGWFGLSSDATTRTCP
jgi:hypothetical protein